MQDLSIRSTSRWAELPVSVVWSLALVGFGALCAVIEVLLRLSSERLSPMELLLMLISIGLLVGLVRGDRAAWSWARLLTLIGAWLLSLSWIASLSALTVGAVVQESAAPPVGGFVMVSLLMVAHWGAYFALGQSGARSHYGVERP